MMKKLFFILYSMSLSLHAAAQAIDFETDAGYKSAGVYDTWEESPFRTGELKGNAEVVDNFLKEGNASSKILGVQRSRFGSSTFGVRVDLSRPFGISPATQYVHVKIHKPHAGKVMLIGLGKRAERTGQSPETEQFWLYSENEIIPGRWNDAVFAVRGSEGVEIHSLVVVPDCQSPHDLTSDFAAYIDDIEITSEASPRIVIADSQKEITYSEEECISVNAASRNGFITDGGGTPLVRRMHVRGRALSIRAVPAPGFALHYVIVRGRTYEKRIEASAFDASGRYTIPAGWITEDIVVEGEFKSID